MLLCYVSDVTCRNIINKLKYKEGTMKTKIALIFVSFIMLQACGSKGKMMHSEASVDNIEVAMVVIKK